MESFRFPVRLLFIKGTALKGIISYSEKSVFQQQGDPTMSSFAKARILL